MFQKYCESAVLTIVIHELDPSKDLNTRNNLQCNMFDTTNYGEFVGSEPCQTPNVSPASLTCVETSHVLGCDNMWTSLVGLTGTTTFSDVQTAWADVWTASQLSNLFAASEWQIGQT